MNITQNVIEFQTEPFLFSNPENLKNYNENNLHEYYDGYNYEGILIKSYENKKISGFALFLPVISQSKPQTKQAVFLANLVYSNPNEAKKLIREGLMCSWEDGYHVAFVFGENQLYNNLGFQKVSKNFFDSRNNRLSLLMYELSWNGLEMISNDLLLPVQQEFV